METVFIKILNMSITASWLVPVVIILRLILRKAPKSISVFMWALVAVRLACPFSFESVFSLIPSAETVPNNVMYTDTPVIRTGVTAINSAVNPIISGSLAPDAGDSANPMQIIVFAASVVWLFGMSVMLLYTAVLYLRIRRKVREAIPYRDNIFICDHIDTPFILGVLRPHIYLPSDMNERDMKYVIAHEKAHLKRHDHLWKAIGFLLLTVYWFNPVLWVAYILLCHDIEFACDERVISDMGAEIKKPYSEALINCSASHKFVSVCPLAFGEVGVKARIKAVLSFKKPAVWIIIVAVIACAALAVGFLTDPRTERDISDNTAVNTSGGEQLTLDTVIYLSKKGEKLSWEDFENYSCAEVGHGLYILHYEIDEMFYLRIGGTPYADPRFIYLCANDGSDASIDIRTDDVQSFINEHKNNPVALAVKYHSCPVDNTGDNFSIFAEWGSLSQNAYLSSIRTLPVIRITSVRELESFKDNMSTYMDFTASYTDAVSFNDNAQRYDDEYFDEKALILVYVSAGSSADRFTLEYADMLNGILTLGIMEISPEVGDMVRQGWIICVELPNKSLDGINIIDARISSAVYPDSGTENVEIIRQYTFNGNESEMSASKLTLFDNGKFMFMFSAQSSYLGYGDYYLDNGGRLNLETDDGEYVYRFDTDGNTMVFDADASSDMLWFSGMYDGCVFE